MTPRKTRDEIRYDPRPAVSMVQKWVLELGAKTGRSLDEWIELVQKSGPAGDQSRRSWLKQEHSLGTNGANWIVERAAGRGEEEADPQLYLKHAPQYVDAMFAGPKVALRPLYEELYWMCRSLGPDIRVCPATTIVPFYRNHVIAQAKPSTPTRIDFGLSLGAQKAVGRLIDTGGFMRKDRITHRLEVKSPADIDDELKRWLKKAYDLDA